MSDRKRKTEEKGRPRERKGGCEEKTEKGAFEGATGQKRGDGGTEGDSSNLTIQTEQETKISSSDNGSEKGETLRSKGVEKSAAERQEGRRKELEGNNKERGMEKDGEIIEKTELSLFFISGRGVRKG